MPKRKSVEELNKWIDKQGHLPESLRSLGEDDIHGNMLVAIRKSLKVKEAGHIFNVITLKQEKECVFDSFLWALAKYGFVIQKTSFKDPTASRSEGQHLPYFLKDFHDAKLFFKYLNSFVKKEKPELPEPINHVDTHIYIVDCFLWALARHNFCIRQSRSLFHFSNLDEDLEVFDSEERERMVGYLTNK